MSAQRALLAVEELRVAVVERLGGARRREEALVDHAQRAVVVAQVDDALRIDSLALGARLVQGASTPRSR
eukprot:3367807-Prymnesium_polylepis.3